MNSHGRAKLVVSVQVPHFSIPSHLEFNEVRSAAAAAPALFGAIAETGLHATWALEQFEADGLAETICSAGPRTELATLGHISGCDGVASRGEFAMRLSRIMASGQQDGRRITTLAVGLANTVCHLDLLVKNGISAVCGAHVAAGALERRSSWVSRRRARFGIRKKPVSVALPLRWGLWAVTGLDLMAVGVRRGRAAIDDAVKSRSLVHLILDASRLTSRSHIKALAMLLNDAARMAAHGDLESSTVAGLVQHLAAAPHVVTARSILRSRAA